MSDTVSSACTVRQGYSLGEAQLSFGITVGISGGASTTSLALSPGVPFAVSGDGTVTVQLLGDLASYSASPDFSSSLLMIPQGPSALLTLGFTSATINLITAGAANPSAHDCVAPRALPSCAVRTATLCTICSSSARVSARAQLTKLPRHCSAE